MDKDFRNSDRENEEKIKDTEDQSYELEKTVEEGQKGEEAYNEEDKQDKEDLVEEIQEVKEEIPQEDEEASSQNSQVCEAQQEGNSQKDQESSPRIEITDQNDEGTASRSYSPSTYGENVVRSSAEKKKKKKGKDGFGIAVMVALLVIILFLISLVGLVLNSAIGNWDIFSVEKDKGDVVNVVKNDGSIKVNEIVGSTGYTDELTIPQVVDMVADTVVEVNTVTTVVRVNFWGQKYEERVSGAGSGVVLSDNGYIITNHHVIDGVSEVSVRLNNGSTFEATVVGSDPSCDVAVIKINTNGLSYARMGSSASLAVGQSIVAIGNPLGTLGGTVTNGIISALDRTVFIDGYEMTLLQTNAAINPGNSGGGLFDMAGQLVGIVNAKKVDSDIEGLGFAIPIDVAWEKAKEIIESATLE